MPIPACCVRALSALSAATRARPHKLQCESAVTGNEAPAASSGATRSLPTVLTMLLTLLVNLASSMLKKSARTDKAAANSEQAGHLVATTGHALSTPALLSDHV